MPENPNPAPCQLILALDLPTRDEALLMLDRLDGALDWVKVGLQLFTAYGPEFIREVAGRDLRIFLDLKLHDIPNTVASAVHSIAALPVDLLTVHACGGTEMLQRAASARDESAPQLKLLGVTVLTSTDTAGLNETGVPGSPEEQVERLGGLALRAGIDGLVCSPLELPMMRERFGRDPLLVTPGIRPAGADSADQKRVLGPAEAAAAGSSFIVVGRPILKAKDPALAARSICNDLQCQ